MVKQPSWLQPPHDAADSENGIIKRDDGMFRYQKGDDYDYTIDKKHLIINVLPTVTAADYFLSTLAVFDLFPFDEYQKIDAKEHISRSPATARNSIGLSKYKVKNGYVYRVSNHWGNVASCVWVFTPLYLKPYINKYRIWVLPLDKNVVEAVRKKNNSRPAEYYFKEKHDYEWVITARCKLSDFERINKRNILVYPIKKEPPTEAGGAYHNKALSPSEKSVYGNSEPLLLNRSDAGSANVQNSSDNSNPEAELKSIIESELATACADNLPAICRMASTPEGKETIANMIFQYCSNNGVSPQTAMAFLESELPPQ